MDQKTNCPICNKEITIYTDNIAGVQCEKYYSCSDHYSYNFAFGHTEEVINGRIFRKYYGTSITEQKLFDDERKEWLNRAKEEYGRSQ